MRSVSTTSPRPNPALFSASIQGKKPICSEFSGRVQIGDAEWSAVAESSIPAGATVKVVSQNNLTMKVKEVR